MSQLLASYLRIAGLVVVVAALVLGPAPAVASPRAVNGQIAFDRFDPFGNQFSFTANPDGGFALPIPNVPPSSGPSWSHDGQKLAFTVLTADGRITTATSNPDGTDYNALPIDDPSLNLSCSPGAWSANDAQLVCQSWDTTNPLRNGIYTISSADGSDLTRLTNPSGGDDEPGAYSPNGKQLVFARFAQAPFVGPCASAYCEPLGLFVINTDGTHLRRITPPGTIIQPGNDGDWSPQGNEIVFSRHVTPDVYSSMWVIHADGTGLHEIHIQGLDCGARPSDPNAVGCHGVHWSPDGKKIIFASNSPATGVNIYIANADGTGLTQVTQDGGSDDPTWGTHPLAY
jgi:Tol biopolymer transport system component